MIVLEADPTDDEDRPVSEAGVERALFGRELRRLRRTLGLTQAEFAERYQIPLANIRQYEIGRISPPRAVRSYLKVIAAEPVRAAAALSA
jgi:putative transcriptional regulator